VYEKEKAQQQKKKKVKRPNTQKRARGGKCERSPQYAATDSPLGSKKEKRIRAKG